VSTEPDDEDAAIWVISDCNPDGSASYIVTVQVNEDVALSLKADAAVRYVATVNRAAVIAKHDAGVMHQLSGVTGLTRRDAAMMVLELRKDREPLHDEDTAPLRYEPIVSGTTLEPFVQVYVGDQHITQWTPEDCFEHAGYVMQTLAGCDLDSAYLSHLKNTIGLDDQTARAAVNDLGKHGLRDKPSGEQP
jgi:hypothetical protein